MIINFHHYMVCIDYQFQMKNNILLMIVNFLLFVSYLFSGTDGQIRGNIKNSEGEGMVGAQVYIEELGIGAVADENGNYILLNVPVGSYDIQVTMISYSTQVISGVAVMMDNTLWLNFVLEVEAIEGDIIYVSGEKELVDKGATAKKISLSQEAIQALPVRDVSELYSLQSGVVKVESGMRGGIPDNEERGLEEVHVRGGRSGEIAYLIDGMYIRNPIYGGMGNGTRLNLFAVNEFDWQPGGFNAEYGDAMSAVSNLHTSIGGDEFSYKFKYENSLVGAALGNHFDELRGYNDYNLGFGGSFPFISKLRYWVSGQYTSRDNYRVLGFDSLAYITNDPKNTINKNNMVQPWDDEVGFRGFGFDKTWDVFGKLQFKPTNKIKLQFSYWLVKAHRQIFNRSFLYWDEGQNEIFRDTERYAFELNHSLSPRTFYTIRYARFNQNAFTGVRWKDSDNDGYPDWFEWSHGAGARTNGDGDKKLSDINNPYVVPYRVAENGSIDYIRRDGDGPQKWTSGWHYGAAPGNYNWDVAEKYTDVNNDGIYQEDIDIFDLINDADDNGKWTGPSQVNACEYRDGSYWLTPEMYVSNDYFHDLESMWTDILQDPYVDAFGPSFDPDSLYFTEFNDGVNVGEWEEGNIFGGHDRFFSTSNALTNEFRFDITSQLNDRLRARMGIDLKSHKLNFYEVESPWNDVSASRQRFAEQWNDFGADDTIFLYSSTGEPDQGEGNGQWDPGESFDDFNDNGKWDDYVEPVELAGYFQTFYELPWMVVNAGFRVDAVNYKTKIWSDPKGNFTPTKPWFWEDCGRDLLCASHNDPASDYNGDGIHDGDTPYDVGEGDEEWNTWTEDGVTWSEVTTDDFGTHGSQVFFEYSDWLYKVSPRFGISHILTDGATFTFNYGLYYQTPVYENIYLNTNRQENPEEVIIESDGFLGNATMVASRTQSYEFGFNVQVGRHWAYTVAGWVKDMDQLSTAKTYRSSIGDYQVAANGDYGRAKGIDLTLENRGLLINTTIQYTFSEATANGEYDKAAFGNQIVDAPLQEFTMPFDRPHDLTVQLYTQQLPFGVNASLVGFFQSGFPYTGTYEKPSGEPVEDVKNKYAKRSPDFKQVDISFSKYLAFYDLKLSLGLNVYNLFNIQNVIDLYPETGDAAIRSEYYMREVKLPEDSGTKSNSYYDNPWHYGTPREINMFMRIDFR
jgi:hypothetical protein